MVERQLAARGITDARVLEAMRRVPRHIFLGEHGRKHAYEDRALSIEEGQTISQPYIVGAMSQALQLKGGERVLEVGTGSGYQAAVLAELGARVYTIERHAPLLETARARIGSLGYRDLQYRLGDGTEGWPEHAPFDGIIVTAAAPSVPVALASQLAEGGRLVIPVGNRDAQELLLLRRERGFVTRAKICDVAFVPLLGKEGWTDE
jgi:protein-L-isoaspartate(D-aspartate) O-methyltransferase